MRNKKVKQLRKAAKAYGILFEKVQDRKYIWLKQNVSRVVQLVPAKIERIKKIVQFSEQCLPVGFTEAVTQEPNLNERLITKTVQGFQFRVQKVLKDRNPFRVDGSQNRAKWRNIKRSAQKL